MRRARRVRTVRRVRRVRRARRARRATRARRVRRVRTVRRRMVMVVTVRTVTRVKAMKSMKMMTKRGGMRQTSMHMQMAYVREQTNVMVAVDVGERANDDVEDRILVHNARAVGLGARGGAQKSRDEWKMAKR